MEASKVNPISDPFPEKAWRSGPPIKLYCQVSGRPDNGPTRKNMAALSANPNRESHRVPAVVLVRPLIEGEENPEPWHLKALMRPRL